MGKFRFGFRLLATLTLLAGLAKAGLAADPTAGQLLGYKPAQKVEVTVPATTEASACVVELEKFKALPDGKQPTAWVVKDSQGKILRKFHDTTGTGGVNIIAYFRDGEEVYRDLITGGKINQFRWVGPEGSKWGVDLTGTGKVESWIVISPEEVSQELLAAVLTNDQKRFEALLITPAELAAMGLPAAETARIQAKLAAVPATFAATCKKLAGLKPADVSWIHLDAKLPQTTPADSIGAAADVVKYKSGAILYQNGNGAGAKHDWLQAGEIIQVGKAWRLIQAPTAGIENQPDIVDGGTGPKGFPIPDGAAKLIQELQELDKAGPGPGKDGLIAFNLKRAGLLQQVAGLFAKAEDRDKRDVWLKQVADSLAAAAQQGDKGALDKLAQWKDLLAKEPRSTILPYFQFRHMSSDYSVELGKVGDKQDKLTKLQESWKEKLTKFITDHPKTDDTPDAILQLGMVNEYFGAKMDGEAKAAYGLLIKNFPTHVLAKKAQGCLDRLTLEGNTIKLAGPTVGGGAEFKVASLTGKAVIVYYWASWNDLAQTDFNKIGAALKAFPGKVEVVGVNLDTAAGEAMSFIKANTVPGTHLHMPGGLDSPLAAQYGITSLPVMFLVGPDGKVITRTAQASTIDEELKKLFKTEEKK
jgi:thiol-disulfide isomerase/thioredoxin